MELNFIESPTIVIPTLDGQKTDWRILRHDGEFIIKFLGAEVYRFPGTLDTAKRLASNCILKGRMGD